MPDHPAYRPDAPKLPAHDPRPNDPPDSAHGCPKCGQTGLPAPLVLCWRCRDLDRRPQGEAMRLFSPAPNQLAGQLTL